MKLDNPYETESQEFKSSLAELDKGLLSLFAPLNKGGYGKIYFGVSNDGTIIGLERRDRRRNLEKRFQAASRN